MKSQRKKPLGVRITGGQWRSRRLDVVPSPGLRPTSDRARETLFNWLGHNLDGLRVVDLFAGSGVLGFEALSRGAASCQFLESHGGAVKQIVGAAQMLEIPPSRFVVHQTDTRQWLETSRSPFDLAFVDPPFDQAGWPDLLSALAPSLSSDARIYVESPHPSSWVWPPGYTLLKQSRVGEAALHLLGWAGPA
ncbi:MAG: 16S rRNA (guanine(966)-N(2))-methyltransferase RsmD [Lysobacterales bacterium]